MRVYMEKSEIQIIVASSPSLGERIQDRAFMLERKSIRFHEIYNFKK